MEQKVSVSDNLTEVQHDGEQDLSQEAEDMLKSWDREQLLKEVREEKRKYKNQLKYDSIQHYDGKTEFSELKKKMSPVGSDDIWIELIESNPSGAEINASTTILFDRIGYLELEEEPWESSIFDGKPSKLNLAEGPIIPGLLEALLGLHEGDRANILIHPRKAYGHHGVIPLVGPDAYLYYHVKIHKVWKEAILNEINEYEKSHNIEVPVSEKMAHVEDHKKVANKYVEDGMLREALVRYKMAIKMIDEFIEDGSITKESTTDILMNLLLNTAVVLNRLDMPRSSSKYAKRAINLNPKNPKGYYNLIKARINLSDHSGATRYLSLADNWCSEKDRKLFDPLRLELDFKCKDEMEGRKEIMKKMAKAYV